MGANTSTDLLTIGGTGNLDVKGSLNFTGQKACHGITSGGWRDTVLVPAGWTKETCSAYAGWAYESIHVLVCIFENTFSHGDMQGGLPSPNCGW